jgi:hypothetical protein
MIKPSEFSPLFPWEEWGLKDRGPMSIKNKKPRNSFEFRGFDLDC